MNSLAKRKCRHCLRVFLPDYRNAYHVQDLLGHQSLTTTERYLRLTITDLKEAHARCHPREMEPPDGANTGSETQIFPGKK